jgi:hypothetical protein
MKSVEAGQGKFDTPSAKGVFLFIRRRGDRP